MYGQTTCNKCPEGTYSNQVGTIFSWLCELCPENHISPEGASNCTPCPTGTVRATLNHCGRCPPGTYFVKPDCENCVSSQVSYKPNQLYCKDCPNGFKPTPERHNCIKEDCPPGEIYIPSQYICESILCPDPFQYDLPNMQGCGNCPPRSYSDSRSTRCRRCPPGTFLYDDTIGDAFSCERCRNGTITYGHSKSLCRKIGGDCPNNSFKDADGDCDRCFPNEYRNMRLKRCVPCPPHTWSRGGVVTKCSVCQPGQDPTFDRYWIKTPCTCPEGQVNRNGKCVKCPSGTYHESYYEQCIQCQPDEFSHAGASSCEKCPAGTTSLRTKGKSCKRLPVCPTGYVVSPLFYENLALDVCVSRTPGCPKGSKNIAKSFTEQPRCVRLDGARICAPWYIYDGVEPCIRCYSGTYLSKSRKRLICKNCPSGSSSPGGLLRRCRECTPGFTSERYEACCKCGKRINSKGHCVPRKGEAGEGEWDRNPITPATLCFSDRES